MQLSARQINSHCETGQGVNIRLALGKPSKPYTWGKMNPNDTTKFEVKNYHKKKSKK